jgi:aryl-alcohol dehydrogenase-like predicted oxidoreductase
MVMQYGTVEGVDKPVSRLVLGTMIISVQEPERSFALLDAVLELGGNTLDTAHGYAGGNSERGIGQWMAERGNREQVVVITKGCHHNADRKRVTPYDLAADLHDSLARLQTDYIDVYLLHRDDPDLPVGPIVEALNEHWQAGRIRAFGGSNWTHGRIQEANEYADAHGLRPFTASSPNYGLAEQVLDPWGPERRGAGLVPGQPDAGVCLLQPGAWLLFGADHAPQFQKDPKDARSRLSDGLLP